MFLLLGKRGLFILKNIYKYMRIKNNLNNLLDCSNSLFITVDNGRSNVLYEESMPKNRQTTTYTLKC